MVCQVAGAWTNSRVAGTWVGSQAVGARLWYLVGTRYRSMAWGQQVDEDAKHPRKVHTGTTMGNGLVIKMLVHISG